MNYLAEYVNYGHCGGNDGDFSDNNSSDNDDNDNDDSNDKGELFWKREFDHRKLVLCTASALALYYNTYIYKEPYIDSYNTGMRWLNELLHGYWTRCVNMFMMDATTFQSLCFQLENQYGLKASKRISVFEKVRMFLYTITLKASNKEVQEIFQHSGETVSMYFTKVLKSICSLVIDFIKPEHLDFLNIPREIANNLRYMPHFKVMISFVFIDDALN